MLLKVFTSASDDMIRKQSEPIKPEPVPQKEILSVPKMKMREKTKLKTIEEIPLEELERQIRDEGELSIFWGI